MTAYEILALHNAWCRADGERMARRPAGMCRAAWRYENPIPPVEYPTMRDTAFKSRPVRFPWFMDHSGFLHISSRRRHIEVIDLRAADADEKLARYEFAA